MSYQTILACGAFGGMCPSIAKLAGVYTTDPSAPMPVAGVYIGIILFAILGAGIAVGFGQKDFKTAIIAGIAAPGIVTNIVSGAVDDRTQNTEEIAAFYLIAPAYAQTVEGPIVQVEASGRILTVHPDVRGGQISAQGLDFTFETANGMSLPGTTLYNGKRPEVQMVVPDGATTLVIGSARFPLSAEAISADVMIEASPTFGGDLLWALGGDRRYAVGEITVTFTE